VDLENAVGPRIGATRVGVAAHRDRVGAAGVVLDALRPGDLLSIGPEARRPAIPAARRGVAGEPVNGRSIP
jgi:hypothetical protein